MSLFFKKDFISHSGQSLHYKIDCDGLTDEDIETLAYLISTRFKFSEVVGIPIGGLRFAKALEKYIYSKARNLLIVDDVLTTGKSMTEERHRHSHKNIHITGIVIFCRNGDLCPYWVHPIFSMWAKL